MDEQKMPRRPRRSSTEEQPRNESLVYGKNPVTELLKSGSGVDTVLIAEGMAPAVAAYYTAMAKEAGATVKRVHPNKLRLMTGTESHQGVAAFASEIEYVTVEDLLNVAREKGEPPFLVLSDGIEDPHNLGAVMRSALLCGAHGIVIPKRGGASVTPTVIKSSAGAAERLPVARVANIGETIRRLKDQGVFVYCADMDGVPLRKNNLTGPIALVLGSEGSGVSQLVKTARITTQPQLEIYADDVKCSHGATVGQMDSEAILYMRQRGLSEAQARRVQIEGFVGDVVRRCGIEPLCEAAMEAVVAKLEKS